MPDATPPLNKIPITLSAEEQLAHALDLCSQDTERMIPDYAAFAPWLAEKLKSERHRVPVPDHMGAGENFILSTAREFARLGEILKHATKENPPDRKDFLKFKLFFFAFHGDERGKAVVDGILASENLDDLQLTEGLASASPATLRSRLFTAMHRDRGHDAFLILGHLKESDLHAGEYAYLRSLCHFRSGQFNEAIEYAQRVPSTALDFPRSVEIRARSHAYLGDGAAVKQAIAGLRKDALSACQVLLLGELTAYHSRSVEAGAAAMGDHPLFQSQVVISPRDPGYGEFTKFHVRLLTGFEERRAEMADAILAKDEIAAPSDFAAVVESDPTLRATAVALLLEPRIDGRSGIKQSLTSMFSDSLLPVIEAGDREALRILFQSLYRLRTYDEFMALFNQLWTSNQIKDTDFLDLHALAYQVAVTINHPLTDELRVSMDALGMKDIQSSAEEAAQRETIAARLTPMGRESYRLSLRAMDNATQEDVLWRDAGLLALGFFRVIEIELNERFVRPAASGIALAQLDALRAAAGQAGTKGWNAGLSTLRSIVANPSERLMLGPLREMCNEFGHPPATIDANLRAFVQAALETQLTPSGRAAFFAQDLVDTVSSSRVQSYRNPPAHGRFVGFSEAMTCKQIVTDTLNRYFSWFVSYAT
ncbi:hypothetical protein [Bradyrhizobium valentinum]|uniref:hypothetical protein n=1 Tax=Bradyrhizobium valentinum TaxID=1518501 RepID=UPI000709FF28|nr:hypothetical protein [Bradyrhizobium valentinum]KRQ97226.1 hypothetical protein CQ10_05185 [Bradyrhizobium valentinum]